MSERPQIERNLAERFQRKLEKFPQVRVHVCYLIHDSFQAGKSLERVLAKVKPHIIVPEAVGWHKRDEISANRVSQGLQSPQETSSWSDFHTGMMEALYHTKIVVAFGDLSASDESWRDEAFQVYSSRGTVDNFIDWLTPFASVEELTQKYVERARAFVAFQEKREAAIAGSIEHILAEAMRNNQSLKKEKEVRVLVIVGAAHRPLSKEIRRKTGIQPTSSINGKTVHFPHSTEVGQNVANNKPVSGELVRKAILSELVLDSFHDAELSEDVDVTTLDFRAFVNSLDSTADLEHLFGLIKAQKADEFALFLHAKAHAFVASLAFKKS